MRHAVQASPLTGAVRSLEQVTRQVDIGYVRMLGAMDADIAAGDDILKDVDDGIAGVLRDAQWHWSAEESAVHVSCTFPRHDNATAHLTVFVVAAISLFGVCSCGRGSGCAHIVGVFLLSRQDPDVFQSMSERPGTSTSPIVTIVSDDDEEQVRPTPSPVPSSSAAVASAAAPPKQRTLPRWMTEAPKKAPSSRARRKEPSPSPAVRVYLMSEAELLEAAQAHLKIHAPPTPPTTAHVVPTVEAEDVPSSAVTQVRPPTTLTPQEDSFTSQAFSQAPLFVPTSTPIGRGSLPSQPVVLDSDDTPASSSQPQAPPRRGGFAKTADAVMRGIFDSIL